MYSPVLNNAHINAASEDENSLILAQVFYGNKYEQKPLVYNSIKKLLGHRNHISYLKSCRPILKFLSPDLAE